jgi:hypothetical protein
MLESIFLILIVLWAIGVLSAYTMGGLIHLLLLLALIALVARLLQGKRL